MLKDILRNLPLERSDLRKSSGLLLVLFHGGVLGKGPLGRVFSTPETESNVVRCSAFPIQPHEDILLPPIAIPTDLHNGPGIARVPAHLRGHDTVSHLQVGQWNLSHL